jgi:hypothetical protein
VVSAPLSKERLAEIVASLPPFPAPGTLVRGLHETVAEIGRLNALVAAMHKAAVGDDAPVLLGLVDDVALTRDAFLAQQSKADTFVRLLKVEQAETSRLRALWSDVAKTARNRTAEANGRREYAKQLKAAIARLRAELDEVQRRYTFDTAELKRHVAALESPAARRLYLAEYGDDLTSLHTTLAEAQACVDEAARPDAAGRGYEWEEDEDGVHVQVWTDPETDRPLHRTLGSVLPLTVQGAVSELTVFRVEYESFVFGVYTTSAAAREHCETVMRVEMPSAVLDWIEDEEDGVAELVATIDGDEQTTGYLVTALAVAAEYDPDGDE